MPANGAGEGEETSLNFTQCLREIQGDGQDGPGLTEAAARSLYAAVLDGGVPELELGALLAALHCKGESLAELVGFYQALTERTCRLRQPTASVRPVVLGSYGGTRHKPNLLPLLAFLLQRFGVPVLIHGPLQGEGRVTGARVFRELGVMPCTTLGEAERQLEKERIAFVPTAVLSPGLAGLMALRSRLGTPSAGHFLARFLDPFEHGGFRVIASETERGPQKARDLLVAVEGHGLLLAGVEGEPYADPSCRPRLEYFRDGTAQILFEAECGQARRSSNLMAGADPRTTAGWIAHALVGEASLPMPIVNQLACCLYGAGYTDDMNQAKAIVAVEAHGLATT
ncbi:MAG: DNA-binding protein YbiB [Betaproteobacteria bacterium]|nr:DNA-binding protein YbiB [Betaproteobacteria bacterium]